MDSYDRVNRQLNLGLRLLGLWLALVSLFFLWQTLDYRGLVARLAEWQYLIFDRYRPTFTFALLVALCAAPLALLLGLIRARQRRDERLGPARVDEARILLGRLGRLHSFFAGICAGCLVAVVILLVLMLQLPTDRGGARSIVIGSPDAIAPADGRARLTGAVDLAQTAQFNENLLLVRRTLYFAPIRSGPDDRAPLRYFVEVSRADIAKGYDSIRFPSGVDRVHAWRFRVRDLALAPYLDGVLRRRALPGEIVSLYRYAGLRVDEDNYVLFHSNAPIRWRFEAIGGQFLIVALLAGLAAALFDRRRRVLRRMMRPQGPAGSARSSRRRARRHGTTR